MFAKLKEIQIHMPDNLYYHNKKGIIVSGEHDIDYGIMGYTVKFDSGLILPFPTENIKLANST